MNNVVITGNTKGFGLAMTKEFLKFGDSMIISSRNEGRVNNTVAKLKELFPDAKIFGIPCDVIDLQAVEALGQFANEKLGTIDIWVNNAGINGNEMAPLVELSEDTIRSVINTNIIGTLFGCQVALKHMLKQNSGKIFNLQGLGSGRMVVANLIPYITTKAAIPNITKTIKKELKGTKVGVHSILPGMMMTELVSGNMEGGEKIANIIAELPQTVAAWVVPKMRKVKGSGKRLKYTSFLKIMFRFMTAWRYKNRFFDEEGNLLIVVE